MRDFGDAAATADGRDKGPEGSLRRVLSESGPGDVIRFERAGVVQLRSAITIPSRLRGIVIDGAVGAARAEIRSATRAALLVTASRASVRNLVFQDATVSVSPPTTHGQVNGVRVSDNRFAGARGRLEAGRSDDVVVEGNEFDAAPRTAVSLGDSDGARVRDNRFAGADWAIRGDAVRRAVITGNQVAGGGIQLQMDRSRVAGNRIQGGSTVNPLWLRGNAGGDDGTVEGNEVTMGRRAARIIASGRMLARDNRFTGAGGGVVILGCTGNGGRLAFQTNRLTGVRAIVACASYAIFQLRKNHVTGSEGTGITVAASEARVLVRGGSVTGHARGGIAGLAALGMGVTDVRVTGNTGTGIRALRPGDVTITQVRMGTNSGPGIEAVAPQPPSLTYDRRKGRIEGRTCKNCRVELYASEPPPQLGNPGRGEGTQAIGIVNAGADGRFRFPRRGSLDCPGTGRITAIATLPGGRSSEFAADVECSCVFVWEFDVDPRRVPRSGFTNMGASVSFPKGTTVGEVTLADVATGERPRDDVFHPQIQWVEMTTDRPGLPPDRMGLEWFAQFTWRDREAPEPTQPTQRWVYTIEYDPPASAKGCDARDTGS